MTHTNEQERAEFEAWLIKHMPHATLESDGEGYASPWAQAAWTGWKAARRAQVVPQSSGVSLDFTRVTEALPELVEFNPTNYGEWSSRLVFVLGANGLISSARLRIGGVNNKQETSELFQSADWQGDPRIIRRGVSRVRSGDVVAWAYSEKIQESALLAAAPQPLEANSVEFGIIKTKAAPVQMPEPWGVAVGDRIWVGKAPAHVPKIAEYESLPLQKLYTEQQVRQLLAAHGITN